MGILQQGSAVFYHPLDGPMERTKSEAWAGAADYAAAGKVGNALRGVARAGDLGAETKFLGGTGNAEYVAAARLSSASLVVVCRNAANGHGVARIGTAAGSDITFGAATEFLSTNGVEYVAVAALDSARFAVAYRDNADGGRGASKIGTVSGTDITFGTKATFLDADGASHVAAAALGSAAFVVAYQDAADSRHGTAKIGTVAGDAIAFGAEAEFRNTNGAEHISVAALGSAKFAVAYRDNADTGHGTAKIGTVAGSTITFGAEAEFSDGAEYIAATSLDASKFVVAYRDTADANRGTARIGVVSGTSIAFGAEKEFLSADGAYYVSVAALSSAAFVAAYQDASHSGHGIAKTGTVSGTNVTFGAEMVFLGAGTASFVSVVAPLGGGAKFAVAYRNNADSNHGAARIRGEAFESSPAGASAAYPPAAGATRVAFCGWFSRPSSAP